MTAPFLNIAHRSFEETLTRCAEIGGVDLIFTSPPYPTAQVGAKGREGAPVRDYGGDTPKHFVWEDYQRLGDYCFRALKPGGFCIVIVDGPIRTVRKEVGSERSLIAFELAIDWAKRVGFRFVEHEAYLRDGPPGDFFPRRRSGFEPMHLLQRPGARGYYSAWAATMPAKYVGQLKKTACGNRMWKGKVPTGKRGIAYVQQAQQRTMTTAMKANDGSCAVYRAHIDGEHPATFTQHIAYAQVVSYSPPAGLVCDPFNGSGTTGIVAARHGRSFIGGDLGARERDGRRWADIGRERAEAAMAEFAAQVGQAGAAAPASEPPPGKPTQLGLLGGQS